MRRSLARIKGVGSIMWHAKHEAFHVLLALLWAWFLRELWNEFNLRWIMTAVLGGLLPDVEHLLYFFTYGKKDPYTKAVVQFLRNGQWRVLVIFLKNGHKSNTNLRFHNYYSVATLWVALVISMIQDWRWIAVLSGAMITHYAYDIVDDIFVLGHINPNWSRWGRGRGYSPIPVRK